MRRILNCVLICLIVLSYCTAGCISIFPEDETNEDEYPECEGKSIPIPFRLHEVHEWGVFQQEYGSNNTNLSAGPHSGEPPAPVVVSQILSKPVIYFHCEGISEIRVEIDTEASDIVTIPQAWEHPGKIIWDVSVAGNSGDPSGGVVIDMLGDSAIEQGRRYRYLFYEGDEETGQAIRGNVTRDGSNVTFNLTNVGNYPIESVCLFYDSGNESEGNMMYELPGLDEMQSQRIEHILNGSSIVREQVRRSLYDNLLGRGLTERECEDLLEFWMDGIEDEMGYQTENPWFQGNGNESAFVLYFITRYEYDELLPIAISPFQHQPGGSIDVVRVGIVTVSEIPIIHN